MAQESGTRKNAKPEITTMKISYFVRDYITNRAKKNESLDCALRRLLKIRPCEKEATRE